ncbi:hypothetical protein OCU04_004582 [Sclerotinia nivalis]|uniref:Uncharacterized protein n=1 Tax=Sclerotinia nivalis TaxID=352851 RepID=A0A9X0DNN5_9HELO|nr:hypothetical protein OCU04_004582 [Sclerotinia nivalis]
MNHKTPLPPPSSKTALSKTLRTNPTLFKSITPPIQNPSNSKPSKSTALQMQPVLPNKSAINPTQHHITSNNHPPLTSQKTTPPSIPPFYHSTLLPPHHPYK